MVEHPYLSLAGDRTLIVAQPTIAVFVDGQPQLLSLDQLRELIGLTAMEQRLTGYAATADDRLGAVAGATNAAAQDFLLSLANTVDRLEPIDEATALLKLANIDQEAILRQADRDRAALAAAQMSGLLDQNVQRITLRNAGIVTDPDTGRIYLYGLDQTATRVSKVEVDLNAVSGQIALRATYNDVATMITQAQLSPADAAEFGNLIARMNSVELSLDSVNAALTLKADAITVTELGGMVQRVSQTLDALGGVISTKVSYSDFTPVRDRIGSVEQLLSSSGLSSSYGVTLRQAEVRNSAAAIAGIAGVVSTAEAAQRQIVRAAEITQQLTTRMDDGDAAEAYARLLLTVRVGDAEGKIATEQDARATQYAAVTRITDGLQASIGGINATITADRQANVDRDNAQSRARDLLQAGLDNATAQAGTDRQASVTRDQANARDIAQVAGDLAGQTAMVSQLFGIVVTPTGATATAMTVLDVNGRVSGTRQTNNGKVSAFEVAADRFAVVDPKTGAVLFYVDANGAVVGRLKANSIDTEQLVGGASARNVVWVTPSDVVVPSS